MDPFGCVEYAWDAQIAGAEVGFAGTPSMLPKRWNYQNVHSASPIAWDNPIDPSVKRLVTELYTANELPRRFGFSVAWVRIDPDELRVYSAPQTASKEVIQHGWLERIDTRQLPSIAKEIERIHGHLGSPGGQATIRPFQQAGVVTHDVEVVRYEQNGAASIGMKDVVTLYRYPMGEYCRALPIPPFFDDEERLNPEPHPRYAITLSTVVSRDYGLNEAAWNKIEALNQLVSDPGQIILVTGKPGSGKELYARAIHCLSRRSKPRVFRKFSAAGMTFDDLRIQLAGSMTNSGQYAPGEIAKAMGGSLMVDELDKACSDEEGRRRFYSWLLRVLEAGEYQPVGGAEQMTYQDVAWLLTGAFSNSRQREKEVPLDFWSRLSGRFVTPHIQEEKEGGVVRKETIVAYFVHWWFLCVIDATSVLVSQILRRQDGHKGLMPSLAQVLLLGECNREWPHGIEPSRQVFDLAGRFAEALSKDVGGGCGDISARTIRQSVKAVVRRMVWDAKGSGIENVWKNQIIVEKALRSALDVAKVSMNRVIAE